jgi:protocatechuate 3,4-dioxygenase beta subunit
MTDMHEIEDHDRGLSFDLPRLLSRRRALGAMSAGIVAATLAACGSSPESSDSSEAEIPDETAGPYPGDGSNGPNVLAESGVVRSDITTSFGDASGVAEGVPTTIEMALLDVAAGGTPLAGAAVYLWHCNIDGQYSMYDQDVAGENYLRGVQESGSDGKVTFKSVFPAAYAGRWPHIHFEVYESLEAATSGRLEAQDLPDRAAEGRVRPRLRGRGLRAERAEAHRDIARQRHGVQ